MKNNTWLLDFKSNTHSQAGEDGIIEKILEILPERDNWCVEFGAWDGLTDSNSRNLIVKHGYSAVLIEADKQKFQELTKNYADNPKINTVRALVGFQKEDGLDQILAKTAIPKNFDFVSIDIDGNDYHVWKTIQDYQPKVVCIEYNPSIPTEIEFVQSPDPDITQGNSLRSLINLGKEKGYELVCALQFNALFVQAEYFPLFEITDNRPEVLRTDLARVTYIFSTYDGVIHLRGFQGIQWHKLRMNPESMQQIPPFLRKFPPNYAPWQKLLFQLFKLWTGLRGRNIGKKSKK